MLNLRMFFQGATLSYIALFHWLQPSQYLATKVIGPLGHLLFFTYMGKFGSGTESVSFYTVGNAVQLAALSGIFGVTFSITGDRWTGTLPYLFGTPANRLVLFIGRAFIHVLDGALGVLIGLMWGVALLGLDLAQADIGTLLLTIVVTTFSTAGLGLCLGSLSLVTRNVMFINNTAYLALLVLSGSNIAIERFPNWVQKISMALPMTRGIQAARASIEGTGLDRLGSMLLGEFLIGVFFVSLGYFLFRWFEEQARARGTLEVV
jgi:ABC-2 type transport system permease protein